MQPYGQMHDARMVRYVGLIPRRSQPKFIQGTASSSAGSDRMPAGTAT